MVCVLRAQSKLYEERVMSLADKHEQLVKVRVGTRHPVTLMFPDGSKRTIPPRVEDHSGVDYYPDLINIAKGIS